MAGWIKLHRKLINSAVFDNEKMLKVWVWCLFKATHKEYEQLIGRQVITLSKGQFITGRNAASTELNMTPSTAWDYLKLLEKNESINIKSNNKYSVVTIVNWELYQAQDEISDSKSDSNSDNKSTTNQQQINTNKNVKNIKNNKNIKNKDVCTEPEVSVPEKILTEKIFISLLLNDKTEYEVEKNEIDTWKELYPAVNIEQELRNMKGWLMANPTKRKTKKGISRFINGWLSREQDKGGNKNNGLYDKSNDRGKGKTEIYDYEKFFD